MSPLVRPLLPSACSLPSLLSSLALPQALPNPMISLASYILHIQLCLTIS